MEFARDAWRRFGKGNHPANLNFGDCFSYALSKSSGELLLFEVMTFPKLMYRVDLRKGAGQAMEKLDYVLMRLEEKVQASSEQKAGLTKPKIVRCNRPSCSRISVLMYRYN